MGDTKTKGDTATVAVIANLVQNGCQVFIPLGENSPVDLIVLTPSGAAKRIQIRFSKDPKPMLRLANVLYKAGGGHRRVTLDRSKFDYFALFSSGQLYYVPVDDVTGTSTWAVDKKYGRLPDW